MTGVRSGGLHYSGTEGEMQVCRGEAGTNTCLQKTKKIESEKKTETVLIE